MAHSKDGPSLAHSLSKESTSQAIDKSWEPSCYQTVNRASHDENHVFKRGMESLPSEMLNKLKVHLTLASKCLSGDLSGYEIKRKCISLEVLQSWLGHKHLGPHRFCLEQNSAPYSTSLTFTSNPANLKEGPCFVKRDGSTFSGKCAACWRPHSSLGKGTYWPWEAMFPTVSPQLYMLQMGWTDICCPKPRSFPNTVSMYSVQFYI